MIACIRVRGMLRHGTHWTGGPGDFPDTLRNHEFHSARQSRWARIGNFFRVGVDVANTDHFRVWKSAQVPVHRRYPAPAPHVVERTLRTFCIGLFHHFRIDAVQAPEPAA